MTGLIANTELVVCAAETRAIHPELFHYTSLDAFEKKWRFIRLERNAAEPVSGPAGPSESLRTCLQFASPQHPAGVISTPPSDLGSSPLPSANEPFQTLQIHELGAEIPRVSAGL